MGMLKHLSVEADERSYQSTLLITHNPKVAEITLDREALSTLYRNVHDKLNSVHILHCAKNTVEQDESFKYFAENDDIRKRFLIELKEQDSVLHDCQSSIENGVDDRKSFIVVERVRSAAERIVNRDCFDLYVIDANGLADWHLTVVQSLLQTPRSTKPTVCLYIGRRTPGAFSAYLQRRSMTTEECCHDYTDDIGNEPKEAASGIAHAIVKFLTGASLPDSNAGRRRHVAHLLAEKGYVEITNDKFGKRDVWLGFVEQQVAEGKLTKIKRGRKLLLVPLLRSEDRACTAP